MGIAINQGRAANPTERLSPVSSSSFQGFRILIVDDHWISASGLSALLVAAIPAVVCEICSSLQDVLQRTGSGHPSPSLIIADFWLSDGTALTLLDSVRETVRSSKVIVLSGDSNPELARKVLAKGAWAFCQKTAPAFELVELIKNALADAPAPLPATAHQAELPEPQLAQLIALGSVELGLTPRQGAVLQQVLAGRANKVIAKALGIGEQTVKEHVSALLARFSVENRVALIRLFADRRLTIGQSDSALHGPNDQSNS